MLNIFCVDLDLPVTIDLYDFNRILHTDFDPTIWNHFHLAVDKNLNDFLKKYKLKKDKINHVKFFDIECSPEYCYVLGWLFSDGYISIKRGVTLTI